ncbi:28S ribosomal protein S10, mitochondrial [Ceratina calcarata]|uniref:Small ribosomal subunit protein uS10m n=1 Tax=Ceratina calcarata TaxID=156304 RepID=A0AAJ7RW24_9HYME|nr:28S ribosomal protein S10, mitochondrial [Ceratina calcarata]
MFRSKVFSVLRTIVNRNSYNIGNATTFQCPLLKTVVRGDSTIASKETDATVNKSVDEVSEKSVTSFKSSSEISIEASEGTSNVPSESTEYEPDKLYKKLEIEVRGNDPAVLSSYGQFTVMAANNLDITIGRHVAPKKAIHERLTVLKSVHVHKKHRVQYETRTYYRYIDFFNLTGSTADTFLEYIQRNLPEGVAMKVTKVELQTLPESVKQANPVQQ